MHFCESKLLQKDEVNYLQRREKYDKIGMIHVHARHAEGVFMKKIFAFLLMLSLLLGALSAQAAVYVDETPPEDWAERDLLRLTVFRTGESDCMLLEAGGESMMIDGGANKWREKLRDALAAREITHLKYIYNTHPHDDHIDGLYRIMQYGVTADEFVSVFAKNFSNDLHKRAVKQTDKVGIPYRQLQVGDVLTLGNATLTIYRWEKGKSINDLSAMAKLEYGDCSALLTADITGEAQRAILKAFGAEVMKADVAKFPHHGLTPYVSEVLDVIDPDFLWATNYNQDEKIKKARNQANNRKIPVKFSGEGTIILESDGTDWYIHQTLKQF